MVPSRIGPSPRAAVGSKEKQSSVLELDELLQGFMAQAQVRAVLAKKKVSADSDDANNRTGTG